MQWILPFLFQQQQQQPADAAEANAMTFNNNDTLCVRVNAAGVAYEEFSCLYPSIGSSYQPIELTFDPVPIRDWMRAHPLAPVAAVLAYGALIVLGQAYFLERQPWDWRRTMAAWNLALAVFSALGFVRTAPQLLHNFAHYSVRENFCLDPEAHYGSGTTGLWVQLFILSKFPELMDTFFIVIHKKKLIFLHWYHHISVLLYCWHSYVTKAPTGIVFCVMNYAVHATMYFYYFLMAAKCKPAAFRAVCITAAQISQMIVGVAVTVVGCYLLWFEPREPAADAETASAVGCWLTPNNNVAALVMYGSYLFLFLQFFLQRYFRTKSSSSSSKSLSAPKKLTSTSSNGTTIKRRCVKEE